MYEQAVCSRTTCSSYSISVFPVSRSTRLMSHSIELSHTSVHWHTIPLPTHSMIAQMPVDWGRKCICQLQQCNPPPSLSRAPIHVSCCCVWNTEEISTEAIKYLSMCVYKFVGVVHHHTVTIVSHCHTLTIATTLSPSTITPSPLTFTHSPCWFHLLSCPLLTASLVCPLPHLLQTLLHTPPSLPEGKGLQLCHKMLLQVSVIGDTPHCLLNFHFQIPFIFLILQLIYIITSVEMQQTATKIMMQFPFFKTSLAWPDPIPHGEKRLGHCHRVALSLQNFISYVIQSWC